MPLVVELHYYDPLTTSETLIRFAMGPGIAPTDVPWIPGGFQKWQAPSQKITINQNGVISSQTDLGELDILNAPTDVTQAGPFDSLNTKIFQGRFAYLYWLPDGGAWASRVLCDSAINEQPIINLNLGSSVSAYMAFQLRDPRSTLTANVQSANRYGGTNSGGSGVDGTSTDLKGKPRPILYGRASNIPIVQVNSSQLIYEVCDKSATVECVRDGAIALTPGTQRGNVASLQANTPTPGTYDWCNVVTEGTYIKLGSTPQYSVACDAFEGSPIGQRTPAQIWSRLSQDRCFRTSGQLDSASITACDALDSAESGVWFGTNDITQLQALDTVLGGFSGFEVLEASGLWGINKLTGPASGATTAIDIVLVSAGVQETAKSRALETLAFVRPDYSPDGAPAYQVTVDWGQNYNVMSLSDFAGAAIQRLIDKFSKQWRTVIATNGNWNPVTNSGVWKNAPALEVQTNYAVGPDGLTCPGAVAEANRLLVLFGQQRLQLQVSVRLEPGDVVPLGAIVGVTAPWYGLSGSVSFKVLQAGVMADENGLYLNAVIGLQRLAGDP